MANKYRRSILHEFGLAQCVFGRGRIQSAQFQSLRYGSGIGKVGPDLSPKYHWSTVRISTHAAARAVGVCAGTVGRCSGRGPRLAPYQVTVQQQCTITIRRGNANHRFVSQYDSCPCTDWYCHGADAHATSCRRRHRHFHSDHVATTDCIAHGRADLCSAARGRHCYGTDRRQP
jgi:hypothetical protein